MDCLRQNHRAKCESEFMQPVGVRWTLILRAPQRRGFNFLSRVVVTLAERNDAARCIQRPARNNFESTDNGN